MSERFRSAGIIGGRLALIASSVASVRVLTELLSAGEIGRMNLVLSIYQWLSLLLVSPIGLFILRYTNAWAVAGTLRLNLRRVTTYYLVVALSGAAAVALVQATIGWGIGVSSLWLAFLIGGHLVFIVLAGTNAQCLNNLGRSWWFILLGNIGAWFGLLCATFLSLSLRRTAEYWLTGLLLGQAVAWLLSIGILNDVAQAPQRSTERFVTLTAFTPKEAWAFAAPIVPITLAYWCQTDGFRFVLQQRASTADVGLFTVAFTLGGTPLLAVERLLVDLLSPAFYRKTAVKDREVMKVAWEEYAGRLLPCVIVCVSLIVGSASLLGHVLLSQKFWGVVTYAVYGALFRGFFVAVGALLLWTHAVEETGSPLMAYVCGAIVALIGVYRYAPASPMHGTGLALVASGLCTLLMVYLRLRKRYGIVLPWRRLLLATAISLPLVAIGLVFGPKFESLSRSVAALTLLLPLTYCAAACAGFSGLVANPFPRVRVGL